MKKIVCVIVSLLIGISIYPQEAGILKEIFGTVELKAVGGAFIPAKNGDQVLEDTVISTWFKSNALLEVGSTLIAVRPLTRLTLTEIRLSYGSETLNVNLQAGRVRVDVKPPAGTRASMSISSPVATASVRGTSFEFDTQSLYVHEGNVSFKGSYGQEISIITGDRVALGENGSVTNPISQGSSGLRPQAPNGAEASPGIITGTITSGETPAANPGGDTFFPGNPSPPGPGPSNDPDVPGIDVSW